MLQDSIDSVVAREMKLDFVKLPQVFEKVKKFYFGDKPIGRDTKEEIADVNRKWHILALDLLKRINSTTFICSCTPIFFSKPFMKESIL